MKGFCLTNQHHWVHRLWVQNLFDHYATDRFPSLLHLFSSSRGRQKKKKRHATNSHSSHINPLRCCHTYPHPPSQIREYFRRRNGGETITNIKNDSYLRNIRTHTHADTHSAIKRGNNLTPIRSERAKQRKNLPPYFVRRTREWKRKSERELITKTIETHLVLSATLFQSIISRWQCTWDPSDYNLKRY